MRQAKALIGRARDGRAGADAGIRVATARTGLTGTPMFVGGIRKGSLRDYATTGIDVKQGHNDEQRESSEQQGEQRLAHGFSFGQEF